MYVHASLESHVCLRDTATGKYIVIIIFPSDYGQLYKYSLRYVASSLCRRYCPTAVVQVLVAINHTPTETFSTHSQLKVKLLGGVCFHKHFKGDNGSEHCLL